MAISLTGLASGLDTESIISQLMAIEQNKVTAVQRRQTPSAAQDGPQRHQDQARRGQGRRRDAGRGTSWKPSRPRARPTPRKVDADAARRRRHRRPHAPGQQARVLGAARLRLHAERGRGLVRPLLRDRPRAGDNKVTIDVKENATAADVATAINANEGAPVYAAVIKDGTDERLVLSARKTGESSNFTVDASALAGRPARRGARYARTATRSTPTYMLDGYARPRGLGDQHHRERDPRRAADAQGRHREPASINTSQPRSTRGDHEEGHRPSSTPTTPSSPPRART